MILLKRHRKVQVEENKTASQSIGKIQVAADQLKGIVEQLKHAADALRASSSSSESSVSEFKIHTARTAEDSAQVNEQMQVIHQSSQQILATVNRVQDDSRQTFHDLMLSSASIHELEATMNSILRGHQQLIQQMNDLVAQSQKIDQVFQLIGSIAEETNILSLNAAIEASRAGEAGKGFSVVADEIRKLSGETQQAVLETKESIQSIQNEIRQSTERVNQETTDINQGAEKLKKVITQLGGFRQKVETIKQSSKESAESVNQQTASISAISELMNQISAMTQTNQALAETVEKDISTQFKSIAQMLDLNKQLIRTSDELQNSIQTDKGMVMTTDPELISQMKQTILHFINDHPLSPIETNRHRGILNTLKNNNPELEAVWSNLPDGSFIYSEPEAALANAGARQWFLEAMKGNIFVSEPYFSAITKQPCVTLSFPIQQSGQINGVFGADLTVHSD